MLRKHKSPQQKVWRGSISITRKNKKSKAGYYSGYWRYN